MKRPLIPSSAFLRAAKKFIKKSPPSEETIRQTLSLLQADPYHPSLRSHKLKGQLQGSWACSAGYDLRIIFRFEQTEDGPVILLESVGTHEEVY